MKIGVPKETAEGERRVALVPDVVRSLKKNEKVDVLIESGAGDAAGHPDAQYTDAGAEIASADQVWGADIVLKVAGEGSWVNIAIGVLGLVTFGAGRIAGAALKVGSRAALGSARLAAGSAAAASPAVRAAQGLSTARNAMTAIEEIAGPAASALTKASARGLALEGTALKSSQGVRDLFAVLKPGAVLSDTGSSIAGALTRTPGAFATWGAAFRAGGASVTTAAAAGPQALVAILSGEREASATLTQLSHVAPELTGASNQFATSMHVSNTVVGASSVATGTDRSLMGYGAYSWLSDQFGPSSPPTLNLK